MQSDQGTTKTIPEVTTTINDCLILYAMASDGSDVVAALTTSDGWTAPGDEDAADALILTSFPTSGIFANFGTRGLATAGVSGIATLTCAVGDTAVEMQLAIAPAAAAGNPHNYYAQQ